MRVSAAILVFVTWPCIIQTQNSFVNPDPTSKRNKIDEHLFTTAKTCALKLGIVKCAGAVGIWKAEKALEFRNKSELNDDNFPWRNFSNISNDEINDRLCDRTVQLLRQRSLELNLQDYSVQLAAKENGLLTIDVIKNDTKESARSMKKLFKHFYNIMPLLLLPGLIMSAILPFVLPSLKMMTLAAGMLNNMALTGAVFTLLRNNAFNDKYHKKIIYVNDGYDKDDYHENFEQLANTPSRVIIDPNIDHNYGSFETNRVQNYVVSDTPINDYEISSEWLKQLTKDPVNPSQIFQNHFAVNDWHKQDTT